MHAALMGGIGLGGVYGCGLVRLGGMRGREMVRLSGCRIPLRIAPISLRRTGIRRTGTARAGLPGTVGATLSPDASSVVGNIAPAGSAPAPSTRIRSGNAICIPTSHVCLSLARHVHNLGIVAYAARTPANPTA